MLMTCPKCGKLVQGMEGDQCPDCKIFLQPPHRIQTRDEDDSPALSSSRTAERPVVAKTLRTAESGTGKGWIAFLRGLLWVSFSLICLAGLYYSFGLLKRAILFATNDLGEYSGGLFLSGIAILLVCVLVAFITLAAVNANLKL